MAGGTAFLAALGDAAWSNQAFGDCLGPTVGDAAFVGFRKGIVGQVITPVDPAYATGRLLYNRRFSPRPMMIVRAANESDIARTIAFARTNGIRLATRSGGHSYIGASGGGGVMLDLSLMNSVAPLGGASFRIGAGTKLVRVYGELYCNGGWTIPCGSCDSVGFGGITLGGGFGFLQHTHGLACDRVRSMRVVLADGTTVTASPESQPDLFWALRGGGGGSFGVVSEFEVEAVEHRTIRLIGWRWPLESSDAALARFHELIANGGLPPYALSAVVFSIDPAGQPACQGLVFSTGTPAETAAVRDLHIGAGGVPAMSGSEFAIDYQTPACNPLEPRGFDFYKAKSSIVYAMPAPDTGARIAAWLAARAADPRFSISEYCSVNFLSLGGAVSSVAPDATAFPHRAALSEVQYLAYWNAASAAKEAANLEWIRGMYSEVDPRLSLGGSGCYVNYADDDLPESVWPQRYFGANYARLQQVKRAVDPTDFFRGKQSIRL